MSILTRPPQYKEVLTPVGDPALAERLVKESSYNYAQLRTPTWIDAGKICAKNAAGKTTGYLAQQYRDVNTVSPTYNQLKTETTNELSPDCPALACSGCNRYSNASQNCETPVEVVVGCDGSNGKYFITSQYQYADGSYCSNADGTPKQTRKRTSTPCTP